MLERAVKTTGLMSHFSVSGINIYGHTVLMLSVYPANNMIRWTLFSTFCSKSLKGVDILLKL